MYAPQFPAHLLQESVEARVTYFEGHMTRHRMMESVEDVLESIWPYTPKSPEHQVHGILYGHTAAGKTSFCKDIRKKYPRVAGAETDIVPVVWFRCPVPFTPKEFYRQGLKAYEAPAPDEALWVRDDMEKVPRQRHTEGALKRRLFDLARQCQTKVWMIDEIHHIRYGQGIGYTIERTLDQLKHLADEAGVMLLLVGTYDTLELFGQNTQLTRRFRRMLLDRYRYLNTDAPSDPGNTPWLEVMQSLENGMPLAQPSQLTRHAPMLHHYTFGLIGLLKPLLAEALRRTLKAGGQCLTAETLEKCRLSDRELREMRGQIYCDERDEGREFVREGQPTQGSSKGPRKVKIISPPHPRREVRDELV